MNYGLLYKTKEKRWIWVAYDPQYRFVIAHHIGDRSQRSAKKLWNKIPKSLHSCSFETDHLEAHRIIIPSQQHKVGKDLTYYIEGFNATIRARVSCLGKTLPFSKKDLWHNLAIAWFF